MKVKRCDTCKKEIKVCDECEESFRYRDRIYCIGKEHYCDLCVINGFETEVVIE